MPLDKATLKSQFLSAWSAPAPDKVTGVTNIATVYETYALMAQDHMGNPVTGIMKPALLAKLLTLKDDGTAEEAATAIAEGIVAAWTGVTFACPGGVSLVTVLPDKDTLAEGLLNKWLTSTGEVDAMADLASNVLHTSTGTIVTTVTLTGPPPVVTFGFIQ